MIYIGVDPGKAGAYAIVDSDMCAQVEPWNNDLFVEAMADLAHDGNGVGIVAAVEKVGAMPGQGVTSMFSFGQSYGFILGVLTAFGIGYQLVPPGVWKREFGLIGKDKRESVEVCKRLFPGVSLLPTEKCRKESDGMADALCIAEWARRKM